MCQDKDTIVYVVLHWYLCGESSTTEIKGIFSTRELAEAHKKSLEAHPANNETWIEEWLLDYAGRYEEYNGN